MKPRGGWRNLALALVTACSQASEVNLPAPTPHVSGLGTGSAPQTCVDYSEIVARAKVFGFENPRSKGYRSTGILVDPGGLMVTRYNAQTGETDNFPLMARFASKTFTDGGTGERISITVGDEGKWIVSYECGEDEVGTSGHGVER